MHVFEAAVPYYLWLLTITVTISSASLITKFSLRMKRTLIGVTSFYFSLSFILWGAATVSMSLHHFVKEIEIYLVIYMLISSLASLAGIYAAYHGMVIQGILVPNGVRGVEPKLSNAVLSALAFVIGFVGFARFALNNPLLNAMMEGMSILTALGFILLAVPLIALSRPKLLNEILYAGAGLTLTMAFVALIGHCLDIPVLYAPMPGGGLSVSTAMGFIGASIAVVFPRRQDLRAKIARLTLAVFVSLIAILALLGYLLNLPILYASSSFARLSIPTALGFILIGSALFWRAWKVL